MRSDELLLLSKVLVYMLDYKKKLIVDYSEDSIDVNDCIQSLENLIVTKE